MTVHQLVRWKPQISTSQETTVAALDTSTSPPTGTVPLIAQLCAYDDAEYDVATAKPGDPAQEFKLVILYESPRMLPLESFAGLSGQQSAAKWGVELTAFQTEMHVNNADQLLQRAIRPARRAAPVVIP